LDTKGIYIFKLIVLLRNHFSEQFYFKFISNSELPGSGMIFKIRIQILHKVSDPTVSGSTTLKKRSQMWQEKAKVT